MNKRLLSVVIPTYDRKFKVIERAIKSVQNQTYPNIDIYLIDDNRGDTSVCTADIIEGLKKYPDVKYSKTLSGTGAQAARNSGIKISDGYYLAFLDDDDYWEPQLAEKEIALIESTPMAGMAYCMGYNVFENVQPPIIKNYYTSVNFKARCDLKDILRNDYIGSTSQAIIKREVFEKCGIFDVDFPARQDYEMWIRISHEYILVGVPEKLFYHTLHDINQLSRDKVKIIKGFEALLKKYQPEFRRAPDGRRNIYMRLIKLYKSKGQNSKALKYSILRFFSMFQLFVYRLFKH